MSFPALLFGANAHLHRPEDASEFYGWAKKLASQGPAERRHEIYCARGKMRLFKDGKV